MKISQIGGFMNRNTDIKYFFVCFLFGVCVLIFAPYSDTAPQISESINQSSRSVAFDAYAFEENINFSEQQAELFNSQFEEMSNNFENTTIENKEGFELTFEESEKFEADLAATESKIQELNRVIAPSPTPVEAPSIDTSRLQTTTKQSCSSSSLIFENQIPRFSQLKPFLSDKYLPTSNLSSPRFHKMCVAYAMNSFNLPPTYFAKCGSKEGRPESGASRPCVTDTIVNLTHNTYIDAMECLGMNPKHVYPKLFNESGFVINTLGGGFDAGVAQMTRMGIDGANSDYNYYLDQIKIQAQSKPQSACARLNKNMNLLSKASPEKNNRCTMITLPDNPLKGFVYAAVLNRTNMSDAKEMFEKNNFEKRIKKLGYTNVDIQSLINIVGTMAYNSGLSVSFQAMKNYIEKRETAGLKLSKKDFNFGLQKTATDVDGEVKDVLKIARLNIRSPFSKKESAEILKKRRFSLPGKINNSFRLSFPEHLIYQQQTNFPDGSKFIPADFKLSGAPGYISFLKDKDTEIRLFLESAGKDPNLCSDSKFLQTYK